MPKLLIKNLKNKKILVTGATGFLGKRVSKRLLREKIPFEAASKSLGVDFRKHDEVDTLFSKLKPDIVINCAAYVGGIRFGMEHEGEIYFNNILKSTYLIEAARKHKVALFVNPISNCSYPDVTEKEFKEIDWWNGPLHPSVLVYGFARKSSWVQAYAYHRQYGMSFTTFLVPNMYGPDDHFDEVRSHALGALIKKITDAKKEKKPEVIVWGTGKPIREWLYVDDFVEIIMRSFSVKPQIEPINVGQGKGTSIFELAHLIKKEVGYFGKLVFDASHPDGAPYKIMNVERLKKIYRFIPPTSLKKGVKKTVQWYYKNIVNKF